VTTNARDEDTKVVYRITYPNGKIYVGMDLTNTLTYMGSPRHPPTTADFTPEQVLDFVVRKQILWEGTVPDAVVRAKEIEFIRLLRANDPTIGYNRSRGLDDGA
jgi:hypothetical protein